MDIEPWTPVFGYFRTKPYILTTQPYILTTHPKKG